jgi:hypothetical protein
VQASQGVAGTLEGWEEAAEVAVVVDLAVVATPAILLSSLPQCLQVRCYTTAVHFIFTLPQIGQAYSVCV